jgi:DNA polymerase-3 subunit alpha
MHRAQYFFIPQGDTSTGLEKIIRFGNIYQTQITGNTNTLFGDLPQVMDVPIPKIPISEPWTLTELLNHEKDVTGMFMSGHPLDHFKFELKHYNIIRLADFNEIKDSPASINKPVRIAGLVVDAQHRVTKTGKNFAKIVIEDYSSNTEITYWSNDYPKFSAFFQNGFNLLISGTFQPRMRYGSDQQLYQDGIEFKTSSITLLETAKKILTKQLIIDIDARHVNEDMVRFFEKNVKSFPGRSALKFVISEPKNQLRFSMLTMDSGFEMNDEMAGFLSDNPEFEVHVVTA